VKDQIQHILYKMSTKLLKKFLVQQELAKGINEPGHIPKKRRAARHQGIDETDEDDNTNTAASIAKQNDEKNQALLKTRINAMLAMDTAASTQGGRASQSILDDRMEEEHRLDTIRRRVRETEDGAGYGNSRSSSSRIVKDRPKHGPTLTKRTKEKIKLQQEAQNLKALVRRVQKDAIRKEKKKQKGKKGLS
jgi:hypothetical protein